MTQLTQFQTAVIYATIAANLVPFVLVLISNKLKTR